MPAPRRPVRGAEASGAPSVHVVTVTLLDVEPPVWRRLEVPSGATLATLHRILQAAMGWANAHRHEFAAGGERFGAPDPDDHRSLGSDRRVRLAEVAPGPGARLSYLYDLRDGWEHEIAVEAVRPRAPGAPCPTCTAGERACPPEGCGGPPGYADLLAILRDPSHEEHDAVRRRLGGGFDPEGFDLSAVNARLGRMR